MTHPEVTIIYSAKRRKTVQAAVRNGRIEVRVPGNMPKAIAEKHANELASRLIARIERGKKATDEDLSARADRLNKTYLESRAQHTSIRWVDNQTTRWGSCTVSTGAIRINSSLKTAPDYVIDAVIIHELVHTFIPGAHPPEFYEWADRAPHAERARGYLEALARIQRSPAADLFDPLSGDEDLDEE